MIKVVIVEDNNTIRKGLEVIINGSPGFACIGSYHSCDGMLKKIEDLNPDILLIDLDLPVMNGTEGIRRVKKILPNMAILVLLIYKESEKLFEAICAGACGYIEKNAPPSQLINTLRLSFQGGAIMSAQVALRIQEILKKQDPEMLTPIEKSSLDALMAGNNYMAIAGNLSCSIESVQKNLRSIYEKLHLHLSRIPG